MLTIWFLDKGRYFQRNTNDFTSNRIRLFPSALNLYDSRGILGTRNCRHVMSIWRTIREGAFKICLWPWFHFIKVLLKQMRVQKIGFDIFPVHWILISPTFPFLLVDIRDFGWDLYENCKFDAVSQSGGSHWLVHKGNFSLPISNWNNRGNFYLHE